MSKTAEELFRQYEGHYVPREVHGGFVALSYAVSLVGALSTLQLINRRTSRRGWFNYFLLIAASITMGGVAIWCMHFIGNRAIVLAHGEPSLQISYSAGFTVLSFFIPVVVLLMAFTAVGVGDNSSPYSWTRIVGGGSLAGVAICGMHYMGDASISNYASAYNAGYVVGSAFIAITASIVALAVFFVFRHAWADSWWKTGLSAVVLAGAVSGMHWCGVMGTRYKLRRAEAGDNSVSMNKSVIVVIVLSVVTCLGLAGSAIYHAKARINSAKKAQQVVLAAAVFDPKGRILVNRNGLLPSESITDTFLDKSSKVKFDTNHPLFHWMFRASRSWSSIQHLIDGMARHLAQLPRQGRDRDARANVNLVSEHGEVMEGWELVFRELFCVAANSLAASMKNPIADAGVLWEEILVTGSGPAPDEGRLSGESAEDDKKGPRVRMEDLEKGQGKKAGGNGSLMFLVSKVESEADIARLGAAGYRFAEVGPASGYLATSMRIKDRDVEKKFRDMATYLDPKPKFQPGVHLGFFGLRPRATGPGYDVLVRKEAKSLLPSVRLPLEKLSSWHVDFLQRLEGVSVGEMERKLPSLSGLSERETSLAGRLADAVQDLRMWVGDRIIEDAVLAAHTFQVPCEGGTSGKSTATLIVFRLVMPNRARVVSSNCTFIPLSLFKIHQLTAPVSQHHLAFSRAVHKELAPILNGPPRGLARNGSRKRKSRAFQAGLKKFGLSQSVSHVDGDRNPIPTDIGMGPARSMTNGSTSTLKLWDKSSIEQPSEGAYEPATTTNLSMLGGIMISEEVTVNVHEVPGSNSRTSSQDTDGDSGDLIEMDQLHGPATMRMANVEVERSAELVTFVDELYTLCMGDR